MAIEKLKLFRINADLANLDKVLNRFVDLDCVHPNLADEFIEQVKGLTSFASANPYNVIQNELVEIEKESTYEIPIIDNVHVDDNIDHMKQYIHSTHDQLKSIITELKETEDKLKKLRDALTQVENIENLDVSLDDLFSCAYISTRVGRLPLDSVEKLKFYDNKPFIFKTFREERDYAWCMYLVTNKYEREIDNIFSSLFFDRIHIPEFVHGTPESAEESLKKEIQTTETSLEKIQTELDKTLSKNMDELSKIKSELLRLNKIHNAKKYVVGLGDIFSISGFVPEKEVNRIESTFKDFEDVEVEIMPSYSDRRVTIPTKLRNSWFVQPFTSFINMYGVPNSTSIDPTPILAITFSLLFGMMFGDLGQGLLLSLFGLIVYKKFKIGLGAIAIRVGLVSAFFGLLYGSFFGNEEILIPMFKNFGLKGKIIDVMAPDFTTTLLVATVGLGSILILTSMITNMYISIKNKKLAELFFSHNGLSGFIFYIFLLIGLAMQAVNGTSIFNIFTIIIFIVIPLVLIVLKNPLDRLIRKEKMFPQKMSEFLIEGFFELFEIVLSYITNTLSFLRVGGFILAHAGMMLVVYTLMDMSPNIVGQWSILIIGNLFVMGLEALIVGIQVLRLEYYEMFSRYYTGDGTPFKILE